MNLGPYLRWWKEKKEKYRLYAYYFVIAMMITLLCDTVAEIQYKDELTIVKTSTLSGNTPYYIYINGQKVDANQLHNKTYIELMDLDITTQPTTRGTTSTTSSTTSSTTTLDTSTSRTTTTTSTLIKDYLDFPEPPIAWRKCFYSSDCTYTSCCPQWYGGKPMAINKNYTTRYNETYCQNVRTHDEIELHCVSRNYKTPVVACMPKHNGEGLVGNFCMIRGEVS